MLQHCWGWGFSVLHSKLSQSFYNYPPLSNRRALQTELELGIKSSLIRMPHTHSPVFNLKSVVLFMTNCFPIWLISMALKLSFNCFVHFYCWIFWRKFAEVLNLQCEKFHLSFRFTLTFTTFFAVHSFLQHKCSIWVHFPCVLKYIL